MVYNPRGGANTIHSDNDGHLSSPSEYIMHRSIRQDASTNNNDHFSALSKKSIKKMNTSSNRQAMIHRWVYIFFTCRHDRYRPSHFRRNFLRSSTYYLCCAPSPNARRAWSRFVVNVVTNKDFIAEVFKLRWDIVNKDDHHNYFLKWIWIQMGWGQAPPHHHAHTTNHLQSYRIGLGTWKLLQGT
jgi:hypothetical protein